MSTLHDPRSDLEHKEHVTTWLVSLSSKKERSHPGIELFNHSIWFWVLLHHHPVI